MTTSVLNLFPEAFRCQLEATVKEALKPQANPLFLLSTHASLQVCDSSGPPASETVLVTVFDGSNGSKVPITLKNLDTIGKLKQKYLKMRPELLGNLNLAYNGKPVSGKSTLAELGVKTCATFITFQKCTGG